MDNSLIRSLSRFLLVTVFFAFGLAVNAQNQIDQTFNAVPSTPPDAGGQVVQSDGKVVVWGNALTADGFAKDRMLRLNVDGSLDPSFDYCNCNIGFSVVMLQADGKLLLSGTESYTPKLIRLNLDGSLDSTYSTAFSAGAFANAGYATLLSIQPDGKALVQTTYSSASGTGRAISRLNSNGSLDSSFAGIDLGFGRTFGSYVTATLILPDGKILFALTNYGSIQFSGVVRRYNADGTSDATFEQPVFTLGGSTNQTSISGLDRQADGGLIVTGRFDSVNALSKPSVVRIQPAGNVDMVFTAPGFFSGGQVQVLSSGKILVAAATGIGGLYSIYLLNSDGSIDNSFIQDPAVTDLFTYWSLDPGGRIVFFGHSNTGRDRFFRLNVNGGLDSAFDPNVGLMGKINASVIQPDGRIVVAGSFTQMNGVARSSFVRLNPNGSLDPSFNAGTGFSLPPKMLLLQTDGKILAVGNFNSYNGSTLGGIARINSDGSLDVAFNPTFDGPPTSIALQTDGKILAVGSFSTVNSTSRPAIARLNPDGSLDPAIAPVMSTPSLSTVAVQADGKILFGGSFSGVNGFSRNNLARLAVDGSLDQTFNAGATSPPSSLYLQADGKVLVAYSGMLSRLNSNGTADTGFQSPSFAYANDSPRLNTVLVQSDGGIIVGGKFTNTGTAFRQNIARFSSSGVLDPFFFPNGSNGEVLTLTAYPVGKVVIGGSFTRFDNNIRAGIVRVNTTAIHGVTPFDFDGDGRADISITRPGALYTWYQLRGPGYTFSQFNFGTSGDIVTPADFDGDGKTDAAIFRPSTGQWWYLSSIDGSQKAATWGVNGDIPLPSDFTGDGKADFVTYRPSTGQWWRVQNGGSANSSLFFGTTDDKPLIGDFDGDGKSDMAVYRPSTGTFWYAASSQGNAFRAFQWGVATDVPAVADYDGDGKSDFAIYRPSNGVWWIYNSSTGITTNVTWGAAEDKPVPADYDGDGRADTAVYRPSNGTWYILSSSAGFSGFQWGITTDVPSPGAFVP